MRTPNRWQDRLSVLPRPMQVGVLHICPRCLKWFAVRRVATRQDTRVGKVSTYRCRHCQAEIEFASHFPSRAV